MVGSDDKRAASGRAPAAANGPVPAPDLWRLQLIGQLVDDVAVQDRLRAIEQSFPDPAAGAGSEAARLDMISSIVELLPIELAREPQPARAVVERILAELHIGVLKFVREGRGVDDAGITGLLLAVARRYFVHTTPRQRTVPGAPTGRPEDERIVADLDALLDELADLPPPGELRLPSQAELRAALTTELCGVYLHLLGNTQQPEAAAVLLSCLPKVLDEPDAARLQLLDTYLRPRGDAPSAIGDVRVLAMLGELERMGRGTLVRERGYLDAGLIARTFPRALPLAARVLDLPIDADLFVRALRRVPLATRVEAAVTLGIEALTEARMLALLTAVDGAAAPLLRPLCAVEGATVRAQLVAWLRRQPLPRGADAALRVLPAAVLPVDHLDELCRLAGEGDVDATAARARAGELLREHARAAVLHGEHDAAMAALGALGELPSAATAALLDEVARAGRFTRFGRRARRLRQQARSSLRRVRTAEAPR